MTNSPAIEFDSTQVLARSCLLEMDLKNFQRYAESIGERITMQQFETEEELKRSNKENITTLCAMFLELRDANIQAAGIITFLKDCLEVDAEQINILDTRNKQLETRLKRLEDLIDSKDVENSQAIKKPRARATTKKKAPRKGKEN